jgi:hypothetical protein
MILIFTIKYDISTSDVIRWLNYYGKKVIRINIDDDTHKLVKITADGIFLSNKKTNNIINLYDAKSCWWRRNGIGKETFTENIDSNLIIGGFDLSSIKKDLINNETNDLKDFIYYSVYNKMDINLGSPIFNLNKLITLQIAKDIGLKTPAYEIITDTNNIIEKRVTKAISNGIYKAVDNYSFYSYTELIKKNDFFSSSLKIFPSIQMELVDKIMEIRSFFIAGSFFSMAIFSQSSSQTSIDFRKYNMKKPNKVEPYKLPNSVEEKLKYLFDKLNLNSGSVDMILNKNNEYVFLEINPVGQYGMVSEPCNYFLDKKIAHYLIYGRIG